MAIPNFIVLILYSFFGTEPKRGQTDNSNVKISEINWTSLKGLLSKKTNILVFVQGMAGTDSPVGYFEANANRIYLYVFPDSSGHAQNMNVANNLTNNSKMMLSGSYQI